MLIEEATMIEVVPICFECSHYYTLYFPITPKDASLVYVTCDCQSGSYEYVEGLLIKGRMLLQCESMKHLTIKNV